MIDMITDKIIADKEIYYIDSNLKIIKKIF